MKRINNLPNVLKRRLNDHSLLKVISGLNNFDKSSVEMISKAAGLGGADLLDVACDPEIVSLAREASGLPICVSSVEPQLFIEAVEAGASMVEIGNFDSFYPKGRFFDAAEVLELTALSRSLLPNIPLSVTVPHFLPLDEQAKLALELVDSGADFIQTEGGTSSSPTHPGVLGLIEKASPTLAATHAIHEAFSKSQTNAYLICASGLSSVTIPMAFSVGASGVGVGSAINRLNDDLSMLAAVKNLRFAIDNAANTIPIII